MHYRNERAGWFLGLNQIALNIGRVNRSAQLFVRALITVQAAHQFYAAFY